MNIPIQCDVVVIGGGPAGSLAGTFLSQKGYAVVLLERKKHPRYQVGESFIPQFWKFCDLANVSDKIEADGFIKKVGGTVVWNGVIRQVSFKDLGYTRPALHIERDRFDHILLEHAREQGVQVFEEVSVVQAKLDEGERVSVLYRAPYEKTPGEISCRFIVDASGQSAVLAKQLGIRVMDEGFRFMSVWGYFKDSKYVAPDGKAYPFQYVRSIPPTTFVSSTEDWGWAWHIPLRESTSVGLVIPIIHMKSIKATEEALEAYFLHKCQEIPYLNRLLEPAHYCEGSLHVIRDYSYRPTQLTGPGFFLIGDAAAFVDPIFALGVTLAMYSAYLAAWAIDCAFHDPARVTEYQTIFANQLQQRLEVARSLALPRHGIGSHASALAKNAMKWVAAREQEVMYVASTLSMRDANFVELVQDPSGHTITSDKFRILEEIVF
jgi:flavin-dependent dehydrogenase